MSRAMITLAGASLAVLGALHQAAAQTVHVSQPENWTAWAALDVQWAFEAPHEDDWVGAFLLEFPATYIKWWPVSASPEWPATDGTLQFELLNGRQPYVFRYFRGDDALAESEQGAPSPRSTAERLGLSLVLLGQRRQQVAQPHTLAPLSPPDPQSFPSAPRRARATSHSSPAAPTASLCRG